MTALTDTDLECRTAGHVDSGGTIWRLRSLVAMGHDATRIANALGVHPQTIQKILRGEAATVTARLRGETRHLWDAWWDKRAPELTCSQRRAAAVSRLRAERLGWCPPLGLDEDELDEPGYRPYSLYPPRPVLRMGAGAATRRSWHPCAGETFTTRLMSWSALA